MKNRLRMAAWVCLLAGFAFGGSAEAPLFYNIAPFSPGDEKTVADDMREYVQRTGNRTVLYSLTLHPEGKPALAKLEPALESYRALKKELAGSDVQLGILLQSIVGHWPRTDREIEPWQRSIDCYGSVRRFCPLDPGYADYIRTVASALAREKPCFILGDDDIRAFGSKAECFCPLHAAEFSRLMGREHSSDEMRRAVAASKSGEPAFEAFMKLRNDFPVRVARLVREGIDAVDPTIPSGACMPGWCYRFNHRVAQAIAAKGQPPVMRLANGGYQEQSAKDFPALALRTQAYYDFHKASVPNIIAEADTYPHYLWSRSSTSFHAHLVMNLAVGLRGAKLWFVNAHKGGVPVSRNYTDVLAANRGLYPALMQAAAGAEPLGLTIPCCTNFPAWHPVNNPFEPMVVPEGWSVSAGRLGVPFTSSKDYSADRIWALGDTNQIERLTDADLREMFRHRVLVDGSCAVQLTKRGFAPLMGVKAERADFLFTDEQFVSTGAKVRLTRSDGVPRLTMEDGAKMLTELRYSPYSGATTSEFAAPGTTVFKNELGGTAVVSAFHSHISIDRTVGEDRAMWLKAVLRELGGDCPTVDNPQDIMALASRMTTGETLLTVFNLNFDPLAHIDVTAARPVRSVELLGGDGAWRPVEVSGKGACVRLGVPLACYQCAVLKITEER